MQADRIYKLAIRKHFTNHECNYPPTREVKLGDYGVMSNGFYERIGNVSDLGISFGEILDNNPSFETFKSSNDVTVTFYVKGAPGAKGLPLTKATVDVSFKSSKSVFFSSAEIRYNEIKDIAGLGTDILKLYKAGKWKKEYYIVTRVLQGANAVVIISGTSECKVSIEADLNAATIDLADVNAKMSFGSSSDTAYEIIVNGTCQIGMGFSRVYDNIFIKPTFKEKKPNDGLFALLDHTDSSQVVFGDTVPEDYDSIV